MTLNVVKLNKAIEVGTVIPMEQCNGNIGRWVEDVLEDNGYTVNRGKGIDLQKLGIEVKTRKQDSTSGHTVGAMLPQDIVNTDWEHSNIHDKVQRQYRVKHNVNKLTGDNVVTSASVYDFTCDEIQSKLKEAWEHGRSLMKQGIFPDYIRGKDHWAYFEMQDNGYYQFRITPRYMSNMESIATANSSKLFNFGF